MCQRVAPCLRATSDTWAPGSRLSATIRALSASERTRRPDGPSRTSSRLTGPTDEPSKWTSFLLSNPIPNLRPSRRLLRTFIRILKQGYRLRAYIQPDAGYDESGFLSAFDSNRDLICAAAAKVYVRGSRGFYDLIAANF